MTDLEKLRVERDRWRDAAYALHDQLISWRGSDEWDEPCEAANQKFCATRAGYPVSLEELLPADLSALRRAIHTEIERAARMARGHANYADVGTAADTTLKLLAEAAAEVALRG